MTSPRRGGPLKSHLERLVTRHSLEEGVAADRVRRWISTMALLGALERVGQAGIGGPAFLLKGGMAIELRVRGRARATRDVDLVFVGEADRQLDALDEGLAEPYRDFTFRRGAPGDLGPHAKRLDLKIAYRSRTWGDRPSRDLGRRDRSWRVRAHPCDRPRGLQAHRAEGDRLPRAPLPDRAAPELGIPDGWAEGYRRLAAEVGLEKLDVGAAAAQVRVLIARIAAAD